MTKYKYGYMLVVTDDNGVTVKYDYLMSNILLFDNSAAYNCLSGIDLCCYNLHNKQDNEDFFILMNNYETDSDVEKINILFELALVIDEYTEAE